LVVGFALVGVLATFDSRRSRSIRGKKSRGRCTFVSIGIFTGGWSSGIRRRQSRGGCTFVSIIFTCRWSSGIHGRSIRAGCTFVSIVTFTSRWSGGFGGTRTIRGNGGSCTYRWSRSGGVTGRGL
jgi:hypothetical protein